MALSNTSPASNSSILYPYENPQTDLGDLGSFRSNREIISIVAILLQPLAQQQKSYLKDWYSQLTPLISLTGLKFQITQSLYLWT